MEQILDTESTSRKLQAEMWTLVDKAAAAAEDQAAETERRLAEQAAQLRAELAAEAAGRSGTGPSSSAPPPAAAAPTMPPPPAPPPPAPAPAPASEGASSTVGMGSTTDAAAGAPPAPRRPRPGSCRAILEPPRAARLSVAIAIKSVLSVTTGATPR